MSQEVGVSFCCLVVQASATWLVPYVAVSWCEGNTFDPFWFCRFSANPLRSSTSWWYVGWCHVWDIVWFSFSSVRVKSGVLKDV